MKKQVKIKEQEIQELKQKIKDAESNASNSFSNNQRLREEINKIKFENKQLKSNTGKFDDYATKMEKEDKGKEKKIQQLTRM